MTELERLQSILDEINARIAAEDQAISIAQARKNAHELDRDSVQTQINSLP